MTQDAKAEKWRSYKNILWAEMWRAAFSVSKLLLRGYALAVIFNWFVAQPFGVSELSIFQALGITLLIRYCVMPPWKTTTRPEDPVGWLRIVNFFDAFAPPLCALSLAWAFHLFM